MDITELFILAIDALKSNIVRTLLTMLGIIIGIASVITIISLGSGSTASIVDEISSFGATIVTVSPGSSQRGPGQSAGAVTTLITDDATALLEIPQVTRVSGVVSKNLSITANGEITTASVKGVQDNYADMYSLSIPYGSFLDESDLLGMTRDVVIGDEVIEELFGEDAEELVIGEVVRIDARIFHIIGIIQESSDVIIPLTTAQKVMFGQTYLNSIAVEVVDADSVETATTAIEERMMLEHEIEKEVDADFSVRSSQAMTESISSVTGTLTTVISGIAAISLLVGGIGIMNIMLVTVTERTKEIGLLKAIGAKKKDILTQFLIESVVLTLFGGAIGMSLGILFAYLGSSLLNIPFIVSPISVVLAMGVSTVIGIVFGWYPANQAAKLNPIDALRYE
ncbi:ABC transporter permease [Candidatus Woesebacteria bacterium]|nr:ABC transporter permease [Candidatus Woesebacteria bacterium]